MKCVHCAVPVLNTAYIWHKPLKYNALLYTATKFYQTAEAIELLTYR